MDPYYEAISKSYQSHLDSIPVETQLFGSVPGKPSSKFSTNDTLTLPTKKTDAPGAPECANFNTQKAPWLSIHHQSTKTHSFLARLGHICVAATVSECRRNQCHETKKIMEGVAPACGWKSFRHWALVAMSCQQAFTTEQKLSSSHTHLVNAVFSCHELIASLDRFETKMPIRRAMDEKTRNIAATMLGVCNVINWMMSIQKYKGLRPIPPLRSSNMLPKSLIGPAVQTALRELDSMKVCRNRLWNMVEVSGRKQMDLPGIIMSLRSRSSI